MIQNGKPDEMPRQLIMLVSFSLALIIAVLLIIFGLGKRKALP